jgi:ubiquinone/menaquinone biosynthesis C-methylase UbiE
MQPKDFYTTRVTNKYSGFGRLLEDREKKCIKLLKSINLKARKIFFDMGCGDGKFLKSLSDTLRIDLSYQGGDFSIDRVNEARKNTGFKISQINLEENLTFDSNYFDIVYVGEIIEHLYNPDNMISEVRRILKKDGNFIITTPNMNSWISRLIFLFGIHPLNYECSTVSSLYGYGLLKKFKKQDWPIGHVRLFNIKSLTDLLLDNGFHIKSINGSVFEFIPSVLRLPDRFFTYFPSLSSGLIVHAIKRV